MSEPVIHVITDRATQEEIADMASYYGSRIKVAVDIVRRILAGGGGWHVNCKEALIAQGSHPEDIWGGAYYTDTQEVDFLSHINIRPQDGNYDRDIFSEDTRSLVENIIRERLENPKKK